MAERYEVVIDFTGLAGKTLLLRNLQPGEQHRVPDHRQPSCSSRSARRSPTRPRTRPCPATAAAGRARPHGARPRRPRCRGARSSSSARTAHWTINGKTWADVIASGFTAALAKPKLDDVEVWTLANPQRRLVPPGPHPPDRLQDPQPHRRPQAGSCQPFERGPKDVVYVGENETVKVIAQFGPQAGPVHDPLPQPGPRGPRHDASVLGRGAGRIAVGLRPDGLRGPRASPRTAR